MGTERRMLLTLPFLFANNCSDDECGSNSEDVYHLVAQSRMQRNRFYPLDLSDKKFVNNYYVSKEIFLQIFTEIEPKFGPIVAKGLAVKEMLAATLRFLAEGSHENVMPTNATVVQSTFSIVFFY
ncbi:uncharacterized protein LOC121596986 [Anopheles merus]|uniref:uncharacterized protein LOC121596986 n=1 Tax=Anopheles merus TaxID=30066 RepID=UPI001BE3F905|nr:uncharacterized protein LOC121596986 [Anopheles merus]